MIFAIIGATDASMTFPGREYNKKSPGQWRDGLCNNFHWPKGSRGRHRSGGQIEKDRSRQVNDPYAGNFDTVELLLDFGADVNRVGIDILNSKYSQSPLSIAALDRFDIAKLLIERGANVNGTKPEELPPLFFATQLGRIEITNLLLDSGANPLIEAEGKSILEHMKEKAQCSGKEKDQKILELLKNMFKE